MPPPLFKEMVMRLVEAQEKDEVLDDPSDAIAARRARQRRALCESSLAEQELRMYDPNGSTRNNLPGFPGEDEV